MKRSNGLKPDRITAYHTRRWEQKGAEIQDRREERRYAKHWEQIDAQSAKEQGDCRSHRPAALRVQEAVLKAGEQMANSVSTLHTNNNYKSICVGVEGEINGTRLRAENRLKPVHMDTVPETSFHNRLLYNRNK